MTVASILLVINALLLFIILGAGSQSGGYGAPSPDIVSVAIVLLFLLIGGFVQMAVGFWGLIAPTPEKPLKHTLLYTASLVLGSLPWLGLLYTVKISN